MLFKTKIVITKHYFRSYFLKKRYGSTSSVTLQVNIILLSSDYARNDFPNSRFQPNFQKRQRTILRDVCWCLCYKCSALSLFLCLAQCIIRFIVTIETSSSIIIILRPLILRNYKNSMFIYKVQEKTNYQQSRFRHRCFSSFIYSRLTGKGLLKCR